MRNVQLLNVICNMQHNKNTNIRCKVCSKLTVISSEQIFDVFTVDFEQILNWGKVDFEQVALNRLGSTFLFTFACLN